MRPISTGGEGRAWLGALVKVSPNSLSHPSLLYSFATTRCRTPAPSIAFFCSRVPARVLRSVPAWGPSHQDVGSSTSSRTPLTPRCSKAGEFFRSFCERCRLGESAEHSLRAVSRGNLSTDSASGFGRIRASHMVWAQHGSDHRFAMRRFSQLGGGSISRERGRAADPDAGR